MANEVRKSFFEEAINVAKDKQTATANIENKVTPPTKQNNGTISTGEECRLGAEHVFETNISVILTRKGVRFASKV